MALAVCLLFDAHSDLRVRELWSRLEEVGIATLATHTHRRHHPHLSYAVLRQWDLPRVQAVLSSLPPADPFSLTVHGAIAFSRGRVALAPAITPDLGVRQSAAVTAVETTGAELHRHYRPGDWIPHVSVVTRAHGAQLPTVVRMVSDTVPLRVRVDTAALVDSATGQTWPLPHLF
ncbi:MAG: 2'-5' RNA ligase family protein [Dermatophilaceae bacterium]